MWRVEKVILTAVVTLVAVGAWAVALWRLGELISR